MANPVEIVSGVAIGQGVGSAIGAVVEPQLQGLVNEQWSKHPDKPPGVGTLALGVAQGQIAETLARQWAKESGYDDAQFSALVDIANVGPGVAAAFELWRREVIGEAGFRRAVRRLGVEQEWIDDLVRLREIRITPSEVANAVQQGHMPNPGILPDVSAAVPPVTGTSPPATPDGQPPSHVPLTQIDVDPLAEAQAHGVDTERLKILANLVGLPPGPEALLTMWNRGLIDEDSVDAGIREGHMKTKWTGAFKRLRWAVLSGQEYAEAYLREWVTKDEMYRGGALTGHTHEQMDLLFKNRGRPASPTQIWTAWARKIVGPRGVPTDFTDHEQAIRRSNIRPEYAEMLWGIRFTYPPYFQINRLVEAGAIDAATGADWMHKNRAAPEVVEAFVKFWGAGTGSTADPNVKKAQTQLWTRLHNSYIAGETETTEAQAVLDQLGVPAEAQTEILGLWLTERSLAVKQLTAAQVKKAYRGAVENPATGVPWTREDALARLIQMGFTYNDANTLLNE